MNKKHFVITPWLALIAGLALGAISRLLDIYTSNLGNIFSQLAIWVLIGVLVVYNSKTVKHAMLSCFLMSIGMIITYYLIAIITKGSYNKTFIIGWTIFAFVTPIFAYVTWHSKQRNKLGYVIKVGIIVFSILSSILLFDRLRVYDVIIDAVLAFILFRNNNVK